MADDCGNSQTSQVNRRAYLAGAAASIAGLSVFGSRIAAGGGYDHVIDLVEKGADDTGGESIVPYLREYAGNDTRLELPEGRYLLDETFRFTDFRNFAIVGSGATVVPDSSFDGRIMFKLGTDYAPATDLHVEGLTFDYTASDTGLRALQVQAADDLLVRDIDIAGEHDSGKLGPALFDIVDPNGTGTVEGFRAPDGGEFSVNTPGNIETGPTGMVVSPAHEGKLWVEDCELGPFPDNGLYVSGASGRVIVKGGRYWNSNVANIRLAGDDSYVIGATVVVDNARPEDENQRGIRLDSGSSLWVRWATVDIKQPTGEAVSVMNDVDSVRIEDTNITVDNGHMDAIAINPSAGPTDIVGTVIRVETGGQAITIEPSDGGGPVVVEGSHIRGVASGEYGRHAIRCERDNCEFRDVTVNQTGEQFRRAIELSGDGCLIYGGEYEATHIPIVNGGDGNRIIETTSQSLNGYDSVKLLEGIREPEVVNNVIYNGIWDKGAVSPEIYGNSYR